MIRTRSGNTKHLDLISNTHPLWLNPDAAVRHRLPTGDLVRVRTKIGYFVARVYVTEAIRPGVCVLSHHLVRWRLHEGEGSRWRSGLADLSRRGESGWLLRYRQGVRPFASDDPDSSRITWDDPGVHRNLAFPVQPDPWSGMHCWLRQVRLEPAAAEDRFGEVFVDMERARSEFRRWLAMSRPAHGPDRQRRPEFLMRPVKPRRRAQGTPLPGS